MHPMVVGVVFVKTDLHGHVRKLPCGRRNLVTEQTIGASIVGVMDDKPAAATAQATVFTADVFVL